MLLFQFHDMLPGSSIGRVHRECARRYADLDAALAAEMAALLAESSPQEAGGVPSIVNTLPVRRTGWVAHEGSWWRYDAGPHETAPLLDAGHAQADAARITADGIANELLSVSFADDGTISALVDVRTGRQHARVLNRLVLHRDP